MADQPKNLENITIKKVDHATWLSQRNNFKIDLLKDFERTPEPSNQCMVSAYSSWALQFGFFANLEKWKTQLHPETIEELIYTLVMTKVNAINAKIPDKNKWTDRFHGEHFRNVFNEWLKESNWQMSFAVATIEKVKSIIDTGQAIVVGTNISKYLRGASGHIQTCVGYYEETTTKKLLGLIMEDPFGDCETNYVNRNGQDRFYKTETVINLFTPCSKDDRRLISYAVKTKG
jgi:hypothetical protein